MPRPAIYGKPMTTAERQRRHKETKRAEILSAIALIRAELNNLHRVMGTRTRIEHRSDLETIEAAIELAERAAGSATK